ncbi:MAG: hypothetical protein LBH74_07500 [Nitrososphaerota archaeon]|jgi:DNA-binding transcriptional ArsR family regulator|uniref:hypothetical protein n=1 Tax=Candidatus Bathycorpusculum sp. TaxID=2994959 RepID=UPI002831E7EF|nr:hypothetical protein [Candidatus Termitimicrobium sp.]MCL2432025.1 hypothetical protein [Candidatus Termitimicrobium sp.]MDR0493464.1 hypothetical protein [Nitrososphaerota archaeon]
MSLSPNKQEILTSMFLSEKPQKATDIAKDTKKEFQPVMMHLLGLKRMGYITTPEKGLYQITENGKRVLGIPETTKEKATAILAYAPHDKAFNFYATIDKPLNIHAHNLRDFTTKLEKVDASSLEFHLKRGDFEAWFKGLGDEELVKKTILLKQQNLPPEELHKQLQTITKQRYLELAKLANLPIPTE